MSLMVNHERRGELAVNVERPTPDVLVTSGGVAYSTMYFALYFQENTWNSLGLRSEGCLRLTAVSKVLSEVYPITPHV
jgi:hypothetical protein